MSNKLEDYTSKITTPQATRPNHWGYMPKTKLNSNQLTTNYSDSWLTSSFRATASQYALHEL